MELKKLFEMQKELDTHINKKHKFDSENLISKKVVAFLVEVSELANEIRFFKYWSNKGPSKKEIILEEYVDGLHFLLSLGLDIGIDAGSVGINYGIERSFTELFISIVEMTTVFNMLRSHTPYRNLLEKYLTISKHLNFTEEEIVQGYYKKNAENHKRQDAGY